MNNKCHKCQHLQQSVYMKMSETDIWYTYWCEVKKSVYLKECDNFKEKRKSE